MNQGATTTRLRRRIEVIADELRDLRTRNEMLELLVVDRTHCVLCGASSSSDYCRAHDWAAALETAS